MVGGGLRLRCVVCGLAGEWMDVHLPFASLIPTVRTTTIPVSQRRKFQGAASDPLGARRDVRSLP